VYFLHIVPLSVVLCVEVYVGITHKYILYIQLFLFTFFMFVILLCILFAYVFEIGVMTDATDNENCADELLKQAAVTMTTTDDKYAAGNELLREVDANIVKTATLRKQLPIKCAQLQARRCRYQLLSLVCISLSSYTSDIF